MNNDLMVVMFDEETDASKARGALEIMRNIQFLGVSDTVMVTMDRVGTVVIHPQGQLRDAKAEMARLLACVFFGKPVEMQRQELVDAGFDERFVTRISSALVPGSSALLAYTRHDSLVDTQQLLDALRQFKGILHHTTVPEEVAEAILKQAEHG